MLGRIGSPVPGNGGLGGLMALASSSRGRTAAFLTPLHGCTVYPWSPSQIRCRLLESTMRWPPNRGLEVLKCASSVCVTSSCKPLIPLSFPMQSRFDDLSYGTRRGLCRYGARNGSVRMTDAAGNSAMLNPCAVANHLGENQSIDRQRPCPAFIASIASRRSQPSFRHSRAPPAPAD